MTRSVGRLVHRSDFDALNLATKDKRREVEIATFKIYHTVKVPSRFEVGRQTHSDFVNIILKSISGPSMSIKVTLN